MQKLLWNTFQYGSVALGAALLVGGGAMAAELPAEPTESTLEDRVAVAPEASVMTLDSIEAGAVELPSELHSTLEPVQSLDELAQAVQADASLDADFDAGVAEAVAETSEIDSTASIDELSAEGLEADLLVGKDSMDQVTSVSQLSDVQPTDWAFQALQSLVERYGCIAGYPDGTFKGNRALSRYEFAAGLNACLDRISELIAAATADLATKEDLAVLQRLQDEFAAELATTRGRVESLEARAAELEANQFSTTTKLKGEFLLAFADTFGEAATDGGDAADDDEDLTNTILSDRIRLNFDTSFTGKDKLRVRMQARNITPFRRGLTGTSMTRLGHDGDNGNDLEVDDVYYKFPIGKKFSAIIAANSTEPRDFFDAVAPLKSSSSGSVSRFGRLNPVLRLPDGGEGVAFKYKISNQFTAGALYFAGVGNDPSDGRGVFNGEHGAMADLLFQPNKRIKINLAYVRYFAPGGARDTPNLSGSTGSAYAIEPFDDNSTSSNSVALTAAFDVTKKFTIAPWFGATFATAETSDAAIGVADGDSATILNWGVQFAVKDALKKGNLFGFFVGMPPKVTSNDFGTREDDDGTSIHIETFYRYKVNDFIAITPGVFVVTSPEHDTDNATQVVGVIRTVFSF